jgi:hypothetical protein
VGGGGAYLFHVCGGPGGEPLGSVNFLEWDGSTSKWHIPFFGAFSLMPNQTHEKWNRAACFD